MRNLMTRVAYAVLEPVRYRRSRRMDPARMHETKRTAYEIDRGDWVAHGHYVEGARLLPHWGGPLDMWAVCVEEAETDHDERITRLSGNGWSIETDAYNSWVVMRPDWRGRWSVRVN